MEDWTIITSRNGYHQDNGCPIGQILLRYPEDIDQVIKDHGIHDPIITKYGNSLVETPDKP